MADDDLQKAAEAVAGARHVVALTGAGLSAESGIPPFRGPGGLWTKHGEPPMNGFERFLRDPAVAWRERISPTGSMKELWEHMRAALPNPGHLALAAMEADGVLHGLITQNIDSLHTLAGSRHVTEIHGNARKVRCIACVRRWPMEDIPVDELPPRCGDCGGILKSDTVSFGEPIPLDVLAACEVEAAACDCMIVAGTSATVYPAAHFPIEVLRRGGRLIEVNLYESEISAYCTVSLRGAAGEVLPALHQRVRRLRQEGFGAT